jgi:polyphosphate glucokinase
MGPASVREQERLSWKKWARRLDIYLTALQGYMWPDLIIVGGGVSRNTTNFCPVTLDTMVVPAYLRNEAGLLARRWPPTIPRPRQSRLQHSLLSGRVYI